MRLWYCKACGHLQSSMDCDDLLCEKCGASDWSPREKECKGKAAARALAVMVLSPEIGRYLAENDPKALEQAQKSLEPFGYPDTDALKVKLGL